MTITLRKRKIIIELLSAKDYLTIKDLAEICHVSARSIRYDLDDIEPWLNSKELSLERKAGKGVRIVASGSIPDILFNSDYDIVPSSQEIQKRILQFLFQHQRFVPIRELSDYICVGRNTINSELEKLRKSICQFNLELEIKPGLGIQLTGAESDFRKCIVRSHIVLFADTEVKNIEAGHNYETEHENLISLIPQHLVVQVQDVLRKAESDWRMTFVDHSFNYLTVMISASLYRMGLQRFIEPQEFLDWMDNASVEKKLSDEIVKNLERCLRISIPLDEQKYFTKLISGARRIDDATQAGNEDISKMVSAEALEITQGFIIRIEAMLGLTLKDIDSFCNALALHIQPMLNRIRSGIEIQNPLIGEIKSKHHEVFNITKTVAAFIEELLGKKLSDAEIGYLSIYICVALEQFGPAENCVKALIVCNSGLGIAQLLASTIQKKLPQIKIIQTLSQYALDSVDEQVDLIISSIRLPASKIPVLIVPPMPDDDDIYKIQQFLDTMVSRENSESNIESMKKLIGWGGGRIGLSRVLRKETIALNVPVENWEEAIYEAGRLLLEAGYIEASYIQKMIVSVKEFGPFIVVIPGVALAHAKPEKGEINQVCLSMVSLTNPIQFGNDVDCLVKLVFAFGAPDTKSHKTLLSQLSNLLMSEMDLDKLMGTNDYEEVMKVVQKFSDIQ